MIRVLGYAMIAFGAVSFLCSTKGFGDIGLSFAFIAIVSILAGLGLLAVNRKLSELSKQRRY